MNWLNGRRARSITAAGVILLVAGAALYGKETLHDQ